MFNLKDTNLLKVSISPDNMTRNVLNIPECH